MDGWKEHIKGRQPKEGKSKRHDDDCAGELGHGVSEVRYLWKGLIHEIPLCDNRLPNIFQSLRDSDERAVPTNNVTFGDLGFTFCFICLSVLWMVTSPLLLTGLMLMLMNLMLNVKLLPTATPFT